MSGVRKTMEEFKAGTLHSGSKHGPKVTRRKQAIAIALNSERKEHKKNNSERHAHLSDSGGVMISHSAVSGPHRMMGGPVPKHAKVDTTALKTRILNTDISKNFARDIMSNPHNSEYVQDKIRTPTQERKVATREYHANTRRETAERDTLAMARKGRIPAK